MSVVWLMAREMAEVIGWIACYFVTGLFIARKVRPPFPGSWIKFRLMVAILWPPVALWLAARWTVMNVAVLMSDLIRSSIQWLEQGKPAEDEVDERRLDAPAPGQAVPATYRDQLPDGEKLRFLYADKQRIDREIREITDRMTPKTPTRPLN